MAQVQADWDAFHHDPGGPVSVLAFPSSAGLIFPALTAGARKRGIELSLSDVDPAEEDFADLAAVLPRLTTPSGTGVVLREITDVPARRFLSAVMRPDRARRLAVRNILDLVIECVRDIQSAADARATSGQ